IANRRDLSSLRRVNEAAGAADTPRAVRTVSTATAANACVSLLRHHEASLSLRHVHPEFRADLDLEHEDAFVVLQGERYVVVLDVLKSERNPGNAIGLVHLDEGAKDPPRTSP